MYIRNLFLFKSIQHQIIIKTRGGGGAMRGGKIQTN